MRWQIKYSTDNAGSHHSPTVPVTLNTNHWLPQFKLLDQKCHQILSPCDLPLSDRSSLPLCDPEVPARCTSWPWDALPSWAGSWPPATPANTMTIPKQRPTDDDCDYDQWRWRRGNSLEPWAGEASLRREWLALPFSGKQTTDWTVIMKRGEELGVCLFRGGGEMRSVCVRSHKSTECTSKLYYNRNPH